MTLYQCCDFDATWSRVRDTLEAVLTETEVSRIVWNNTFADVYALCDRRLRPRLYNETKQFMRDHVERLEMKLRKFPDEDLINNYWYYWLQFYNSLKYVDKLFLYLNQDITFQTLRDKIAGKQKMISVVAMEAWNEKMLNKVGEDVVKKILKDRLLEVPELPQKSLNDIIGGMALVYQMVQEPNENDVKFTFIELIVKPPCPGDPEQSSPPPTSFSSKDDRIIEERC